LPVVTVDIFVAIAKANTKTRCENLDYGIKMVTDIVTMNYTITFKDGTIEIIDIIATTFKKMKVWKISFSDGKDIVLCKVGSQWLQRKEDFLEQKYIISIGAYIDALQSN
jgi:hypothetical protein